MLSNDFYSYFFPVCTLVPSPNSIETELMQYRWPVGCGPSSKTWPRWLPQFAHKTSVRFMPRLLSSRAMTFPCAAISEKLGQPQPESNLASDLNKTSPHAAQRYTPGSLLFQYLPVKACSVPASRRT